MSSLPRYGWVDAIRHEHVWVCNRRMGDPLDHWFCTVYRCGQVWVTKREAEGGDRALYHPEP